MEIIAALEKTRSEAWSDEEIVDRVKAGDTVLYEIIMRRYNQRLYRVGRAILRDDAEAEDVMQDAYVRAYEHLAQFAGRALFFNLVDPNCGPRSAQPPPSAQPRPATRFASF